MVSSFRSCGSRILAWQPAFSWLVVEGVSGVLLGHCLGLNIAWTAASILLWRMFREHIWAGLRLFKGVRAPCRVL